MNLTPGGNSKGQPKDELNYENMLSFIGFLPLQLNGAGP
jgi:hypothetical protein